MFVAAQQYRYDTSAYLSLAPHRRKNTRFRGARPTNLGPIRSRASALERGDAAKQRYQCLSDLPHEADRQ